MTEYQPRTPERLVEMLRSFGHLRPTSWESEAADLIERLIGQPQSPKLPPIPIHWARPYGATFEEMRSNVRATGLYEKGDTILIWVNEGDFAHACIVSGSVEHAVAVSRPDRNFTSSTKGE